MCHGNVCRSPFASRLLARLRPDLEILSRGASESASTSNGRGRLAAKKVRDYASRRLELNLHDHRSRQITLEEVIGCDGVVLMDGRNMSELEQLGEGRGLRWPKAIESENHDNPIHRRTLAIRPRGGIERYITVYCLNVRDPAWMRHDSEEFHATMSLLERQVRRIAQIIPRKPQ